MKNVTEFVERAGRLQAAGKAYSVATVVKILGSTYRRPGARLLVDSRGYNGMISGGCLEPEVAQQARKLIGGGKPRVLSFDLTEEDPVLGFGTGCSGVVDVLVEASGDHVIMDLIGRCLKQRRSGVLAQVIGGRHLGQKLLVTEDGVVAGTMDPVLSEVATPLAREVLAGGLSVTRRFCAVDEDIEALFEIVRPPLRLAVFGTGNDIGPLVHLGQAMGWETIIVGRRAAPELAKQFPNADRHVFLMHPEKALQFVELDRRTAAVVMNHNYVRDRTLVGVLLKSAAFYVGALGPRDRTMRIRSELVAQGDVTDAHFEQLHGPVGLDIGTETPEEIALAIVAEIQAVSAARSGGMLRDRAGAIHDTVGPADMS